MPSAMFAVLQRRAQPSRMSEMWTDGRVRQTSAGSGGERFVRVEGKEVLTVNGTDLCITVAADAGFNEVLARDLDPSHYHLTIKLSFLYDSPR
ncbi:uncharacterized protein MYCFIDRAFT_205585 [Pseudocercospora fijiensis CIRAD86]|uniref:Uncharacterized protein n=1 Tax=Pseudocercospora fijiensis (strain CIRAD86) TaxID=383855 RepID=N1Q8B6_PSEFD|nr:uncharacterized protein MYCFIDRAFT_205585 [Pseudocercospora fijiensis CIRAD86]EME87142.1 hypothetical protein MYCFIDRAFT_205585 [Pseudocercospora fijiensis CIRAD86]